MTPGSDLEEPWYSALIDAGFVDTRTGKPSQRQLAESIGVHPSTVSRAIRGSNAGSAAVDLVYALAGALHKTPTVVASWVGRSWSEGVAAYEPPAGTEVLSHHQREALNTVVRAMIAEAGDRRTRRALGSRAVVEIADKTGLSRGEVADILEAAEAPDV